MVNVNSLPCSNCIYFNGVKQPDGTEVSEYVACKKAKTGKSDELLKVDGRKLKCEFQERED